MRHFATKKLAIAHQDKIQQEKGDFQQKIFKKIKGQKNRIQKPFVVGTELEWLNLY